MAGGRIEAVLLGLASVGLVAGCSSPFDRFSSQTPDRPPISGPAIPGVAAEVEESAGVEIDIPGRNLELVKANPRLIAWAKTLPAGMWAEVADEGPNGEIATVRDKSTGGVRIRELPTKLSRQVKSESLDDDEVRDSTPYRYRVIVLAPRVGVVDQYAMIDTQKIISPTGEEHIDGNFVSTFDQGRLLMSLTTKSMNPFYPMRAVLNS